MGFCERRFPPRRTRDTFGASVISSVIALAESENRHKQTAADDRTRKRQFADSMRVLLKMPVFVGVSENGGKDSLPPSHLLASQLVRGCEADSVTSRFASLNESRLGSSRMGANPYLPASTFLIARADSTSMISTCWKDSAQFESHTPLSFLPDSERRVRPLRRPRDHSLLLVSDGIGKRS
jgi:hypothetical protein